jgi:mRNA-degrading endonuclease RelE of RelBE toxin-antitoxin system
LGKYEVDLSCPVFQRNLKKLRRKFPAVKDDLKTILDELENRAPLGDAIPLIKAPVYKVRVRNTDIPKGKSSGYRLIYNFDQERKIITLLLFYFKAEKPTALVKEIKNALDSLERGLFDEV